MGQYYDEEDDIVNMGPPGTLGRVRYLSPDRRQVTVELRGGQFATVTSNDPMDLTVGNIVIVHQDHLEPAAAELWGDQTWVGVVKIKRPDRTVIDAGGRWLLVPTNEDVDYSTGNTVEVSDSFGVVAVLHPDPIRLVEFGGNWMSRSSADSNQRRRTVRRPLMTLAGCTRWLPEHKN